MVISPEERDQDYAECLTTLLRLSPWFSTPTDVQGGSGELKTLLKDGQSSIIYLHGPPGVGKGAVSRTLLRTLHKPNPESVSVVYFSFSDQDVRRISSTALMSSMIFQNVSQNSQRFGQVCDLYLAIKKRSIWGFEALWNLFCSLLAARDSGPIFCIVNQNHNCDSSRTRFMNRLLNRLADDRRSGRISTPLKVILIGELRQDIQDSLEACPQLQRNFEQYEKTLRWMLHAQRPMAINELSTIEALVEDENTLGLDTDRLLRDLSPYLRDAFHPLIKEENNEVYWSHEQVKTCFNRVLADERQFRDRNRLKNPIHDGTDCLDHWYATSTLLKYLCSEDLKKPGETSLQRRHVDPTSRSVVRLDGICGALLASALPESHRARVVRRGNARLSEGRDFIQVWWGLKSRLGGMDVAPDICVTNPLSLAAYLGFADVVNVCLEVELLKGGGFAVRGNAIALASWAGHLDIVTKLFDDGFDKETANDTRYLTEALTKASDRGHYEIVGFQMDHIPKPTNGFVWDPVLLCRAAEVGYETLVESLQKRELEWTYHTKEQPSCNTQPSLGAKFNS